MTKTLLATGYDYIDDAIEKHVLPKTGCECINKIQYRSSLINEVKKTKVDMIITSKFLSGTDKSIVEVLSEIKQLSPMTRIIYLAGESDDERTMIELGTLAIIGVYDIITEQNLNMAIFIDAIQHPKTLKDVSCFTKYLKKNSSISEDEILNFEEEEEVIDEQEDGLKNVYMVSSIKPGTGKSFVSANLATIIAKYGSLKSDNTSPRVALIEGDFQNLSIGTLLNYRDNNEYNLKTVMDKIAELFSEDGEFIGTEGSIMEVNTFIDKAFQSYKYCKNLYALIGSQIEVQDFGSVKSVYYQYLISYASKSFDIVIVDTNSSIFHFNTVPILKMCNTAYYVLNLDFNNIRNNKKYQSLLTEIGVMDKVQYILNEDIDKEYRLLQNQKMFEMLKFSPDDIVANGFNLVAKIPEIPREIFLNRLYDGQPIVLDSTEFTLKARCEISSIANNIWKIESKDYLEKQYMKYKEKVTKQLSKKSRKRS